MLSNIIVVYGCPLDFGTTFSGISYAYGPKGAIETFKEWYVKLKNANRGLSFRYTYYFHCDSGQIVKRTRSKSVLLHFCIQKSVSLKETKLYGVIAL